MKKTLMLTAAIGALALGGANVASAAPASGVALYGGDGSNLLQDVARRRVCTWRRGIKRCVWYGNRRGWRKGRRWRWSKRNGVNVRIYF